jgi:hypothetical protein
MLKTIIARLGGNSIVAARLGGPPAGFEPTDGSVPPPPSFIDGKWLYTTVSAPAYSWKYIRSVWEADLVAGALSDAMHAEGADLYSEEVSLELPDGTVIPNAVGGLGEVKFQQQFPTPSAPLVAGLVTQAASEAGLDVRSMDVLTADQPAPAVVLKTDNPRYFVEHVDEIIAKLVGNPPAVEGYYIRVDDAAGNPVFVRATAFRIGAGHEWVRPDLDPRGESRTKGAGESLVPAQ